MKTTSFWSHFEEPMEDEPPVLISAQQKRKYVATPREDDECKSNARDKAVTSSPLQRTKTFTEAREEYDQDFSNSHYKTIPESALSGTMTVTHTREEIDQDPPAGQYGAVSVSPYVGTQTFTKVAREEADQDAESLSYQTLFMGKSR